MHFRTPAARICFKGICAISASVLGITWVTSVPAQANTIAITDSFTGMVTGPPTITGTILRVDGLATGSVLSGNPTLNSLWNPVSFSTHNVVDLTTGLDNGSFSMTFANHDTLSGNLFENDSMVDVATGTGPFTQTLTFTVGTGEFTGATGSVSGGGLVEPTGFSTSGSGTLDAPAIPEPASAALVLGGLALVVLRWRQCGAPPQ